MAVLGQPSQDRPFLPRGLHAGIKRLAALACGVAVTALAAAGWASLLSWSIGDPSLNNATGEATSNWMGPWGATAADLALQSIGLAAIVLYVPLAAWGRHLTVNRIPASPWWRLLAWPASALALATGLSALPAPGNWPLPNGLGGIMGDVLMSGVHALAFALPKLLVSAAGGLAFIGLGAWGTLYASAIPLRALALVWKPDEADEESGDFTAAVLGALTHWLLGSRAEIARGPTPAMAGGEPAVDIVPSRAMGPGVTAVQRRAAAPAPQPIDSEGRIEPFFDDAPAVGMEVEDPGYHITRTQAAPAPAAAITQSPPPPGTPFTLPALRLLKAPPRSSRASAVSDAVLRENAQLLESVLQDFGVKGEIVNVHPGPVVTLYELEPAPGTKSSRVIGLADDIARSMSAIAARVAVVPGRNAIGIELPNESRETVFLRELLEAGAFVQSSAELELALGKNIGGEPVSVDLSRMPHLLIAGTTGSGKSVGINTMILSLLYRLTPEQCKFIMIDPKMLELSVYDGIPHLLAPVVTDPKKAIVALKWTVKEMEERYKKMSKLGVRNMHGYNARVSEARARGETITRTVQTGFDRETGQAVYEQEVMDYEPLPYIVVIVDEMADLMMVAGREIEGAVQRLAQMARAAGIHMITATQRPSVDVITGTIKANFPTRISFQVTSKIDSRTILGDQGAEQLLGRGDMLYMAGGGRITRVHGPFVSDEEVERVVRHLHQQGVPRYLEEVTQAGEDDEEMGGEAGGEGGDLYGQAVAVVLRDGKASTSYIQRRLSIGYNRAATLIERMEEEGVVSPANSSGKREILIGSEAAQSPY